MPAPTFKIDALQAAVCRGVVEGNRELVAAFLDERNKRHDLRNDVQNVTDKTHGLDSEIKLIKGVIVTLVGNGDGSSGMVPRLERDLKVVGEDVANLAGDVRAVTATVNGMAGDIKTLLENKEKSQGFMAGWNGAKTAITILGTIVVILGFLVARGFHL